MTPMTEEERAKREARAEARLARLARRDARREAILAKERGERESEWEGAEGVREAIAMAREGKLDDGIVMAGIWANGLRDAGVVKHGVKIGDPVAEADADITELYLRVVRRVAKLEPGALDLATRGRDEVRMAKWLAGVFDETFEAFVVVARRRGAWRLGLTYRELRGSYGWRR